MAIETIKVPDIGGSENVDIIEICVAVGDVVSAEDSLLVLESDKASMDIPSPLAGKVTNILVKEGDQVSQGSPIFELETSAKGSDVSEKDEKEAAPEAVSTAASSTQDLAITVPDIGGSENVDVIEVCVKVGDQVTEGDSLVVLESDKASMEVPSPATGVVVSIALKEGDKVSEGSALMVLSTATSSSATPEVLAAPAMPSAAGGEADLIVPDIGGSENVDIIEVCVAVGDQVAEGDSLMVLESDKASMELPSPFSGKILSLVVKAGDKVSKGHVIGRIQHSGQAPAAPQAKTESAPPESAPVVAPSTQAPVAASSAALAGTPSKDVYAGPAVRKLARQMGVDLSEVPPSGPRGRMSKDDVRGFVKGVMTQRAQGGVAVGGGIPSIPAVDFAQFGEIETVKMSKIKKLTAANMTRNWLNIPHVTQFDDADISELESFRKSMKAEAEKAGVRLTPLPFLLKACAAALKAEPNFNVSLHADGEHIVQKKYVHIGMAVDTPAGLMVPVIRDVDRKGLFELAEEMVVLATKAREGKLMPRDMQGGCFTISSLGAIGGTGFTPIVNAPEVAILGVSRAETKPFWDGKAFVPRLMMPLCLSYDHRAINGSDAGRFLTYLSGLLSDVRRLLL